MLITRNEMSPQKEIADKVHEMILSNLDRHITISELAQTLHVSPTQIKMCFHNSYGVPVYSYSRQCRMEAAAKRLRETDESILEIAGRYGYENGSKFSAAFRKVTGVSPSRYRRQIRWEMENDPDRASNRDYDSEITSDCNSDPDRDSNSDLNCDGDS